MANHVSAEKRNRQRIVRTDRNRALRSAVRTALRKAREALASGNLEEAKLPVYQASKTLARAVARGVIPSRQASRKTSRIQTALATLARTGVAPVLQPDADG